MSTTVTKVVADRILVLRGQRVMLDADLAGLYGVDTKVLNQAVKRNAERFPMDFMFQLTAAEKAEVVTNCDHLGRFKFSSSLPYAFTEHGALMLGNVRKSSRAVEVSLLVLRAFVQIREMKTVRHSRAGGNPGIPVTNSQHWIPACAGMTGFAVSY